MNLNSLRIGRRRFAFIYFGALGFKILALIIAIIISAAIKLPPEYWFIAFSLAWVFVDVCLLPTYAGRLNDVSLSLYCLFLLYVGDAFFPGIGLLIPYADTVGKNMNWLFQPLNFTLFGVFSLLWFISIILWIYLFFKKGETHAAIS